MRIYVSLPELLALVEIIDEHVDRTFPGIEPPRVLRDLKAKAHQSIERHQAEIAKTIQASRTVATKTGSARKVKKRRKVSAEA